MSWIVRQSGPGDAGAIRRVLVAAFPTEAEADLVEQLGRDGDVAISLVAEDGEEIVGHVLMSRMSVTGEGGNVRALGLAPAAVPPSRQRSGIGSALIREALALAEAGGEDMVFVVGEPDYYRRFGFSAATARGFESPYAGPYLMAVVLGDASAPASGRADYAPAFAGLA